MTLQLQMPPGLEASLRDQAAREGIDASTLVLRALQKQFGSGTANLSPGDESELLLLINQGPTESIWRRYHELAGLRDSENLSSAEHQELISLSEKIEAADVSRLAYMADLAHLRGVSLRAVREQLGIPDSSTIAGNGNG